MNINCKVSLKEASGIDLSVIIPIYNGKLFIAECLDSVLNQKTEFSYEIILVDDGSTDGLEEYLNGLGYQSKIKYLKIKNSGQGYARNRGLEVSCGKRITFLDADDALCEDFIQTMLSYEEDLVQCGYKTFGSKNGEVVHKSTALNDSRAILKLNCYTEGYPWGKVYKRELFNEFGFPEKIHFEDNNLSYLVLPQVKSYRYVSKALVNYRIHEAQETANVVKNKFGIEQARVICCLHGTAKEAFSDSNLSKYLDGITLYNLTAVLKSRLGNDKSLYEKAFCTIVNYFEEQNYDFNEASYKGKKFIKALKKRDLSCFIRICRYL